MIKFKDSNFLTVPNHPEIKVGADQVLKNGYAVTITDDMTVAAAEDSADLYLVYNIIDKPEILNTEDFELKTGEFVRAYRMQDLAGLKFEISGDLVSDTYATVVKGNKLVPDATNGGWKVGTIAAGGVGFEVKGKNTFGMFTVNKGTDVAGGFDVQVVLG